jgi:hypothetical protein
MCQDNCSSVNRMGGVIDQKHRSLPSFEISNAERRPAGMRGHIIFVARLVRKALNRVTRLLIPSLLLVPLAAAPAHLALSTDVRRVVTSALILIVACGTPPHHPASSHRTGIIRLRPSQCASESITTQALSVTPLLFPLLLLPGLLLLL